MMIQLIEPVYPKSAVGRPAYPPASMIRVYCMQQWYALSDPAMEEVLYEIASMRRFAGFSLSSGSIPDETMILNFRHLLEAHGLTEKIFALINQYLVSKGLRLSKGTIVDATITEAPSSTKRRTSHRRGEHHLCSCWLPRSRATNPTTSSLVYRHPPRQTTCPDGVRQRPSHRQS